MSFMAIARPEGDIALYMRHFKVGFRFSKKASSLVGAPRCLPLKVSADSYRYK
jgi:hypothetical protein